MCGVNWGWGVGASDRIGVSGRVCLSGNRPKFPIFVRGYCESGWPPLENAVVLDPDSRLTQLGLLPLGDENRYPYL